VTGSGVSTSISFGEAQYLFPSFLQRLLETPPPENARC
jgi:hypothetical protein